ncbi:GLPGLI family protein [Chryseobacterium taklimakanense]|uniref:GLPGLI family protein n=1 Tax=Chryseobacterium taklimakanense TaxID=536441 RepID=UPI0023F9F3A9|nr:GLPGLI family protein [Chryseobacterium taklimakanense]
MMKILHLIILLLTANLIAQNQRFIYEYSFNNDSTAIDQPLSKEMMYLDVAKKGSKFYSYTKFQADSIIADRSKKNPDNHDFTGVKFGKIHVVIEKTYPDFKVSHFDYLDMNDYQVLDSREIKWKILPEKEKIGEFETQKAETFMFGRKWTAWYTPEIPIQDGPYKFRGLPGLIVKVSDPKNTHVFELKGVKKLSTKEEWSSAVDKKRFAAILKVDEKQFKKLFVDNRENPTKGLRQMLSSGAEVIMTDEKGNTIDIEKIMREQERNAKEQNKKNNNLLELDLIK